MPFDNDTLAALILITGLALPLWLGINTLVRRWEDQARSRKEIEAENGGSPAEPKKITGHVHDWVDPECGDPRYSIGFLLTGKVCECGAWCQYEGPAYGWRMVRTGMEDKN